MSDIVIGIILITILMLFGLVIADKKKPQGKEKYFDDRSGKLMMGLFTSIIASFGISMSANIPDSAGLGGLIWIFGPVISGVISSFVYLIAILINTKLKVYVGWTCIIFNLATGIYLFFSA